MELNELINRYGALDKEAKTLKKEMDGLNKTLKGILKEEGLDKYETDLFKVTYQVRKSESLDEDKVIKILTNADLDSNIVKMKPYIDEEALEMAIYNREIPQDILLNIRECTNVKEVQVLTVKEVK